MKKIEVASGAQFGDLVVVREIDQGKGKRKFLCKCSCGASPTVRLDHLRSGHTKSCGNCGIEHNGERMTLREWASFAGVPESTLRSRLKIMDMGEALLR